MLVQMKMATNRYNYQRQVLYTQEQHQIQQPEKMEQLGVVM